MLYELETISVQSKDLLAAPYIGHPFLDDIELPELVACCSGVRDTGPSFVKF